MLKRIFSLKKILLEATAYTQTDLFSCIYDAAKKILESDDHSLFEALNTSNPILFRIIQLLHEKIDVNNRTINYVTLAGKENKQKRTEAINKIVSTINKEFSINLNDIKDYHEYLMSYIVSYFNVENKKLIVLNFINKTFDSLLIDFFYFKKNIADKLNKSIFTLIHKDVNEKNLNLIKQFVRVDQFEKSKSSFACSQASLNKIYEDSEWVVYHPLTEQAFKTCSLSDYIDGELVINEFHVKNLYWCTVETKGPGTSNWFNYCSNNLTLCVAIKKLEKSVIDDSKTLALSDYLHKYNDTRISLKFSLNSELGDPSKYNLTRRVSHNGTVFYENIVIDNDVVIDTLGKKVLAECNDYLLNNLKDIEITTVKEFLKKCYHLFYKTEYKELSAFLNKTDVIYEKIEGRFKIHDNGFCYFFNDLNKNKDDRLKEEDIKDFIKFYMRDSLSERNFVNTVSELKQSYSEQIDYFTSILVDLNMLFREVPRYYSSKKDDTRFIASLLKFDYNDEKIEKEITEICNKANSDIYVLLKNFDLFMELLEIKKYSTIIMPQINKIIIDCCEKGKEYNRYYSESGMVGISFLGSKPSYTKVLEKILNKLVSLGYKNEDFEENAKQKLLFLKKEFISTKHEINNNSNIILSLFNLEFLSIEDLFHRNDKDKFEILELLQQKQAIVLEERPDILLHFLDTYMSDNNLLCSNSQLMIKIFLENTSEDISIKHKLTILIITLLKEAHSVLSYFTSMSYKKGTFQKLINKLSNYIDDLDDDIESSLHEIFPHLFYEMSWNRLNYFFQEAYNTYLIFCEKFPNRVYEEKTANAFLTCAAVSFNQNVIQSLRIDSDDQDEKQLIRLMTAAIEFKIEHELKSTISFKILNSYNFKKLIENLKKIKETELILSILMLFFIFTKICGYSDKEFDYIKNIIISSAASDIKKLSLQYFKIDITNNISKWNWILDEKENFEFFITSNSIYTSSGVDYTEEIKNAIKFLSMLKKSSKKYLECINKAISSLINHSPTASMENTILSSENKDVENYKQAIINIFFYNFEDLRDSVNNDNDFKTFVENSEQTFNKIETDNHINIYEFLIEKLSKEKESYW